MRRHIPKEYKEIALHLSLDQNIQDKDIVCPGQPRLLDGLDADVGDVLILLFLFLSCFLVSRGLY